MSTNTESQKGLRKGAIGLVAVLFMAVANAAPITAMSFNVPIGAGYGNGIGVPAGFLFATIVLSIFAIGFSAMAKHITTAGAFYGFISQGLGQVWGMAAGLLATVAYILFEGTLIGGFSYFAADTLSSMGGIDINWLIIAVGGLILIWVLTYFDITLAAAILGVTLVAEVLLLLAFAFSVVAKGGPDGFMVADTVAPMAAFGNLEAGAFGTGVAAGTAALGIFFAFWSWIGFETTAAYGEESKDPKNVVPRATMIAVIGLGVFYTFVSWMVVVANGAKNTVEVSSGSSPINLWLIPVEENLGSLTTSFYRVLLVIGSFACALAFHNAASRYVFALGRELPFTGVRNKLSSTHPKHQSPAVASTVVTVINIVMVLLFTNFSTAWTSDPTVAGATSDPTLLPYSVIYTVPSLVGTAFILVVQVICSFAVIGYFWGKKKHKGNVLTTLVAPLVGAAGMIYALTLLFSAVGSGFAAGNQSNSLMVKYLLYEVTGTLLIGLLYALWVKSKHPEIYEEIGRTTMKEAHERV
jgi:amino acid transporter